MRQPSPRQRSRSMPCPGPTPPVALLPSASSLAGPAPHHLVSSEEDGQGGQLAGCDLRPKKSHLDGGPPLSLLDHFEPKVMGLYGRCFTIFFYRPPMTIKFWFFWLGKQGKELSGFPSQLKIRRQTVLTWGDHNAVRPPQLRLRLLINFTIQLVKVLRTQTPQVALSMAVTTTDGARTAIGPRPEDALCTLGSLVALVNAELMRRLQSGHASCQWPRTAGSEH
mmetsp:Transcript_70779/g.198044  ORF Transcript_70779/g.198044 Transcript_70779/m.198044 type:complete len:223 (+) Transcript_70779:2834-3502(+)